MNHYLDAPPGVTCRRPHTLRTYEYVPVGENRKPGRWSADPLADRVLRYLRSRPGEAVHLKAIVRGIAPAGGVRKCKNQQSGVISALLMLSDPRNRLVEVLDKDFYRATWGWK